MRTLAVWVLESMVGLNVPVAHPIVKLRQRVLAFGWLVDRLPLRFQFLVSFIGEAEDCGAKFLFYFGLPREPLEVSLLRRYDGR